jgi:hypothetical protein
VKSTSDQTPLNSPLLLIEEVFREASDFVSSLIERKVSRIGRDAAPVETGSTGSFFSMHATGRNGDGNVDVTPNSIDQPWLNASGSKHLV